MDVKLWSRLERVPVSVQLIAGCIIAGIVYFILTGERPYAGLPVITVERKGWQSLLPAKFAWILDSRKVLAKGTSECTSCFQVLTGSGYKVIVPNRFANELKSHPDLNFNEAFAKDFFVEYPGFEGHRQGLQEGNIIQEVVRVKLTQSLGLVTDDLVDETASCVHEIWGEDTEWQTRMVKEDTLNIVARLSSRVFLGKDLCRDQDWLRISKDYTVDTFIASALLRLCPDLLRPMLYWVIPTCTRLRREVRDSRRLILPEVDKRIKQVQQALDANEKPPKTADTIGWMVEVARDRPVDYVAGQLSLTMAAIHTTSETTTRCILQLCDHPEALEPLRAEMIKVLRENGWSKVSLYKMKLLDSFLKEVQRVDGMTTTSMNRLVKRPITLSDGTELPTGCRIMVLDDKTHDAAVYPEPAKFDAARFLRMRQQPGEENRHQFVTTTPDHMGFGHGQHACPGRFFASNEIKIALCFLLLKYDFRYLPGEGRAKDIEFESANTINPKVKVQLRRRQEEIDLMEPSQMK